MLIKGTFYSRNNYYLVMMHSTSLDSPNNVGSQKVIFLPSKQNFPSRFETLNTFLCSNTAAKYIIAFSKKSKISKICTTLKVCGCDWGFEFVKELEKLKYKILERQYVITIIINPNLNYGVLDCCNDRSSMY